MNFVRKFHQMIPLPTGEVLTVGGNNTGSKFTDNGSVHHSEIWNPQTGAWRTTAALSVPRDYHSTALLMTDGRIITAGGGYHPGDPNSGGTHADAQIYSPAYLFNSDGSLADRPVIESDLEEVNYSDSLSVTTTGSIDYFSLVKMSATTHAINTDARHFRPSFSAAGFSAAGENRYDIVIHDNPNVATPGYWMLFAVDTNGVPSVAEIIRIASDVVIDTNNGEPSVVSPIETSAVETMNNVRYDISATGSNLTYRWNFGDGSGDTALVSQNTIYHFYSQPGRYLVNVTVSTPAGLETVASFYQVVHASLPENKPEESSGLMELATRRELWNVNPDNNSVAITSTSSLTRDALVPVGVNPRTLAQAPDGRVWVINKDDASISVIDPDSRNIQQTIQLDRASRPHGIVFNDHSAYITLEAIKTVVQLNATTGTETNRLVTGYAPKHISLNANGDRLFVSDYVSPAIPGEDGLAPALNSANGYVNVLSTTASTLGFDKTINLQYSNRDVSEHSGPGVPNYLGPVVISPLGDVAWLPSKQDNIVAGERRGGEGISFDQTVRAVTSKIDLSTETEVLSARIDHDNSSVASHGAYGPYGHILFVSLEGNRQVALIDTSTNLEYARFDVGMAPQSLLLSESGERLYVHNFMDRSVAVVDVSDVIERAASQVEIEAVISTVASEQLSAEILRGKQLFYDARDDRLAGLDYMACAACHNDGENDGRTWDFSGLGEGLRNTNNLRGNGKTTGRLHWSANFDEVQDFETPIRSFAGGKGLMEDADFQTGSRSNAFGLPKAGVSADLDALAAYVESLNTALPSPHRSNDGSLTPAGASGRSLFEQSGCGVCHAGDKFTDSASGQLHDVGTHNANSGERSGGALTGIDTPTLLGSWKTAPYLHNGSAATLVDAIQAHGNLNVSAAQASELAAFVQQIDSTEPAVSNAVPENPDTGTPQFDNAYSTYANINIDGNMSEWPLSASIGIDPQDSTGGANQLDFERGWLAHDDRILYIRYDNHTPNDTRVTWGYSVSIDVDGEENGFNDGYLPIGVDFLIEGKSIYRYTGDGSNWSWAWMADFPLRLNGRSAELAIERTLLGNPETFSFFFYADNNAIGGTALDFLPDAVPDAAAEVTTRFLNYAFDAEPAIDEQPPVNGPDQAEIVHNLVSALEFDGNVSDWNAFQSFGADPDDVFESDSSIDFLRGWGGHDESHFYFAWSNDGPGSLTWGNAIYVDTDLSYGTGFRGFLNDSPIGIDYLLEADGLYRYSGNGTSWSWVFVAGTEVLINGNSLELRVPIALLDSAETIDLFFYGDNTPVNTNEVDFYPDGVADESLNNAQRHFRYSRNAALATAQPDAVVTGVSQ